MAKKIFASDRVLTDNAFLSLVFPDSANIQAVVHGTIGSSTDDSPVLDVEHALGVLRSNPVLSAKFLSQTQGNGSIYWAGGLSAYDGDGRSLGVSVIRRRDGEEASGDNLLGEFFDKVRTALRRELSDILVEEVPVREGQVITDFTRKGAYLSDIEERERSGEEFIHVDVYRPARFRFDAGRDGTTGHAERASEEEVPFHRFVCPFGTAYPSPIIVGSAEEASVLYEQALRGEIDWKALFNNLKERNLIDKKLNDRQIQNLISDYKAQFEWMREQIVNNDALRERPIVASSWMVPDSSMGRSIYDAQYSPSPAQVLARYINNPLLLYSEGENGVVRSLNILEKEEPERFSFVPTEGKDEKAPFTVLVAGSDTIGGREPGRKATATKVREESVNANNERVITSSVRHSIPMKEKEVVDREYAVFSARMDSILEGLPEGRSVRLVSGNVSSFGNSIGVGTPRMLERYVREKGGSVLQYDFSRRDVLDRNGDREVTRPELSVVLMEHFADCLPVLSGQEKSVKFRLNDNDDESEISFSDGSLSVDGAVCFSSSEDLNNRNVLSVGSYVMNAGLPVIHVQENRSEEQQRVELSEGAMMSRSGLNGSFVNESGLFEGELRTDWPLADFNHLSSVDDATGLHFPLVAEVYPSPVLVEGYSFRSPLSVYIASVYSELGLSTRENMQRIAAAEGSSSQLLAIYAEVAGADGMAGLSARVQEKLLRRSVRMVAQKNDAFMQAVLDLDDRGVVMTSTVASPLFVTPDGHGENRFGVAFSAERQAIIEMQEGLRLAEERERQKLLDEAVKRQRIVTGARAEGQKIVEGLPKTLEESEGAVWFIGTHNPLNLSLKDDELSFAMWDDMNGDDPLVREKAARPWVDDGEGGRIDNKFMFLFPTDLETFTGRRAVKNYPESKNLQGVTRVDPKTGQTYAAAVGIPVRFDNRGNELVNDQNYRCSYRMDNDASNFAASVVLSDSKARSIAIQHGLCMCLPGRERMDGSSAYTLGQVFMEKTWNRKEQKMVPNPHRSPLNLSITESYISLLEAGKYFPLNCIPMPRTKYLTQDDELLRQKVDAGQRFVSAEGRFISDLMLSLQIANATALALGVPLRFPLDKEGRIDLGPGVPEEYRLMAEQRINSFIGVKKQEEQISGKLPLIERLPLYASGPVRDCLVKTGTDLYMRPNDLAVAFGPYDFSGILSGSPAPLHEMTFRFEDGTIFTLKDSKTTRSMQLADINKYLDYSKNDERRFIIRSTDPSKTPYFVNALKAYVERAKAVKVRVRLVQEQEVKNGGLEGFVNLLSSNSEEFAMDKHDIGREMDIHNAAGTINKEGAFISRDVDGNDVSGTYYGKVDARDGFRGYAQLSFTLPDGREFPWETITDLELAKDTVMSLVKRTYRTDNRVVPSDAVMEMLHKAEAVRRAGFLFRDMEWKGQSESKVDEKVVSLAKENPEESKPEVAGKAADVEAPAQAPAVEENGDDKQQDVSVVTEDMLVFTRSEGGYQKRTYENAQADDVDFTVQIAVDLTTYGERATAKAAGESLISVETKGFSPEDAKKAVDVIYDSLPEEFQKGEPLGFNFAGNGIYTLAKDGVTQDQVDEFMVRVISGLQEKGVVIQCGRSGGQTGLDEAALAAGITCGVPMTCHAPYDWTFRIADKSVPAGYKDIKDEKAFKDRLLSKDIKKLQSFMVKPKTVGKRKGQSIA